MKIIEARDGFIKFEADKSIYLSDFICVNEEEKDYIAQVLQIKKAAGISVAFAKILFIGINGELTNYDNTLPQKYFYQIVSFLLIINLKGIFELNMSFKILLFP